MKRTLITGANRGLGLEMARQCAARGDQVFAGCRCPEKAAALEALSARYPRRVTILPLEVTDEHCLAQSAARVAAESTGLDILFNNAAIFADRETLQDFSATKALEMLNVNAVGPLLVAKHFLGLLKAGRQPRLICISSEAGSISRMTSFRGYYYYGSKAALNMHTRSLAFDPETEGITVIAMHPGWVRTDMGGPNATLSPAESAAGILRLTNKLTPADNGKFYTWEGQEYPW